MTEIRTVFSFVIIIKLFCCISGYNDTIFGFEEKKAVICDSGQLRLKCKSNDVIVLTEVRQYYNNVTCADSSSKCRQQKKNEEDLCFMKGNSSVIASLQHGCDLMKHTAGHCELPLVAVGDLTVHYVCWNHTESVGSCEGNCGKPVHGLSCECVSDCVGRKDCCPDYGYQCVEHLKATCVLK